MCERSRRGEWHSPGSPGIPPADRSLGFSIPIVHLGFSTPIDRLAGGSFSTDSLAIRANAIDP